MYIYLIDYNYNNWYYIGKTNNIKKRFQSHKGSAKYKKAISHKIWNKSISLGNIPEIILLEKTNEDDIDSLEIWYIAYLRWLGVKLANMTAGGGGLNHLTFSKEHCEKISRNKIGKYYPTAEHKEILKQSNIGPRSDDFKEKARRRQIGVKHSEATKLKMSQSGKGKHPNVYLYVKVEQIDKITNEVLRTFDSMTEAAKFLDPKKYKSIRSSIECAANPNGKQNTCRGYIWRTLK